MNAWPFILPMSLNGPNLADANRLIAETRAEEVVWHGFSGFVADIEVELEGRAAHGRVIVQSDGRICLEHFPNRLSHWATERLCRVIQQRLVEFVPAQKAWMFVNCIGRCYV